MRLPHLTIYSDKFVEDGMAGATRGCVIFIRPAYKHDKPLYEHEYTHVKQWYMTLGLFGIFYKLSKRFRLWAEANAYAVQVNHGADIDLMADYLSTNYGLGITADEAKKAIKWSLY